MLRVLALAPQSLSNSLEAQARCILQARKHQPHEDALVPRVLEPLVVRLFDLRSKRLSYETIEHAPALLDHCVAMLTQFVCAKCSGARAFQSLAKLQPC